MKLNEGQGAATKADTKNVFTDTQKEELALYGNTFDIVIKGLKPIVERPPIYVPTLPSEDASQDEKRAAAAEIVSAEFGLKISKFFLGILLTMLHSGIAEYIDECESYLGRPVGSHDARKRVTAVLKEVLLAIPGLFVPPLAFLDAAKEAWKQLKNSPRAVDKEKVRSATETWEALITFRDRLTTLDGHRSYLEGMVQTSVDGVLEGIIPIPHKDGPESAKDDDTKSMQDELLHDIVKRFPQSD